ncbi:MAG TPA: ABC transporter permease [Candidatus Nanoarchaeia archaeon]|nr:ABC transporter permease [Candidatus Nanoarchaeia archaeon]
MLRDYFVFSFHNLKSRRLRSFLTVIGIFIGVLAVVSLVSLGEGLRQAIISQFGISSTEVISVQAGGLSGYGPPGTAVVNPLTEDDALAIERINSVERAVSRSIENIKVEFNDRVDFTYATDIPDGDDRKFVYAQVELEAIEGRLLREGDNRQVALGYNFAEDDKFGKRVFVGDKILVNNEEYGVVGITAKKGSFIFDNVVYFNRDALYELMEIEDDVDIIAVQVKDKSLIQEAEEDIEKLLRKRRDVKEGNEDFEVSTPEASLSSVNQILLAVQSFIAMIALISVAVGGIGIVNTMTTSVMERRREIGIMKAIGARNRDIFMQFFIESGLLGLVGGLLGVIVGVIVGLIGTAGINSFVGAESTPQINLILIILTLLGSFLIGSLAGIIPALHAAKQKPVDALRS